MTERGKKRPGNEGGRSKKESNGRTFGPFARVKVPIVELRGEAFLW
jgi:hypothetical protein